MTSNAGDGQPFNILIVGQAGRLAAEALLFAASLRRSSPGFTGRLIVAEPQPGPLWPQDPRLPGPVRDMLGELGAEVVGFDSRHFGAAYPYGNKIEGLACLPVGEPFVFFDTDTLVMGELQGLSLHFPSPSASMKREGTWPVEDLYWPGYSATWKALYDRFELDFAASLDLTQPDEYWERYLYFNAGWFCGSDPALFGQRFTDYALSIRDNPPPELVLQPLDPWLDQVVLPLVIHSLGGGRPGPDLAALDGPLTCHWRRLPLLYARESDAVVTLLEDIATPHPMKRLLKDWEPLKKMIYQGQGRQARALFDRDNLPRFERAIRNRLRQEGLWIG